jgi:hypothetical protein
MEIVKTGTIYIKNGTLVPSLRKLHLTVKCLQLEVATVYAFKNVIRNV